MTQRHAMKRTQKDAAPGVACIFYQSQTNLKSIVDDAYVCLCMSSIASLCLRVYTHKVTPESC